jgi:hypothetical protein
LTAAERAQGEIRRAAERAAGVEHDLELLADQMLEAGASPDLNCQEAVSEATSRLRALSESLPE